MRFKKGFVAVAGALAAVSMMASSAGASAALYPAAIVETETGNAAHFQQVALQSLSGNETCRVDVPVLVSQPEIDTRVTVKGEDTAATTVECVDLLLQSTELITATLYVEYRSSTGWVRVAPTVTPGSSRMVRGAGALSLALDYVYPAGDASQGKPHRACVDLHTPKDFLPLCSVPTMALTTADIQAS